MHLELPILKDEDVTQISRIVPILVILGAKLDSGFTFHEKGVMKQL